MQKTPVDTHFSQEAIDEIISKGNFLLRNERLVLRLQVPTQDESVHQETYKTIDEYLVYETSKKRIWVMFEINSELLSKDTHLFFDLKQVEFDKQYRVFILNTIECFGKRAQLPNHGIDDMRTSVYYHKHKYKNDVIVRIWNYLYQLFSKKEEQTLVVIEIDHKTISGMFQKEFNYVLV